MEGALKAYLSEIGRKGGQAKSKAKRQAARRNAKARWAKVRATEISVGRSMVPSVVWRCAGWCGESSGRPYSHGVTAVDTHRPVSSAEPSVLELVEMSDEAFETFAKAHPI